MSFNQFKKVIITSILVFFYVTVYSQEYVDLVSINYGNVFNVGYDNDNATTNIKSGSINVLYPIELNEKVAIISGLQYSQQSLALFPNSNNTSLSNLTFKAGVSIKHSKKLSGTYIFLPKFSSEKLHLDGNDFFLGGIALLKYQKNEKLQWRFGAYGSSEGFGVLYTPIIGIHYLSTNKRLEASINLPVDADIHYRLNNENSLGFSLQTPVKTYSLESNITPNSKNYVQVSNIEFGPYFERSFLDNSVLLRMIAGYSTINYEVFEEGDTLPIKLSALDFNDERNLINPSMKGNVFFRLNFIYRFHLNKK